MSQYRLGITIGDPAGVGPEIVCRALAELRADERAACVVFGSLEILERANRLCMTDLSFTIGGSTSPANEVQVRDIASPGISSVAPGRVSEAAGAAAYANVVAAVEAALAGDVHAIVTAPLNKAALNAAGHKFSGHTELLAHLCRRQRSYMLLASERLATIHVSTHVSLAEAVRRVGKQRILETIEVGNAHLRQMGFERPRIAVAGLNPHCGEGGLFGNEDIEHIEPAVRAAKESGVDASGPIPADSVFLRAVQGEFDLVVAQYHDQGHIPCKLIAFESTVNVTLGLPIARTSVDHGTAFDIAWKGIARHKNMLSAIAYARRIAQGKRGT
jgi:4-hydroxythreonine-4-phosphate dehydrogenase